jgi:hypothetical protein
MKVKEVHAGRLYRVKTLGLFGFDALPGGYLWVAEESGQLSTKGGSYVRTPFPFRSVATGEVLEMSPRYLDQLGLEEADGGDT